MSYHYKTNKPGEMSVIYGCCLVLAVIWIAYLILGWWATGLLLDWANSYWHLGWVGGTLLAAHIITFFLIMGFLGRGTSAVARSQK